MSGSQKIDFSAREYQRDTSFREASYEFEGSPDDGWFVRRDGAEHLRLGPGYRLLRTECCGVCSTDLSRHFLPFPLPQITGHEVVARDPAGARYVVEINASHRARRVEGPCPFCRQGLETHCPDRIVLGIHDLPGGFGPWILAPVGVTLPLPDAIPTESAVLIEPFAAALAAATRVEIRPGDRVAVLGPRRLGMLIVAALASQRKARHLDFQILALSRHPHLLELAQRFGADQGIRVEGDGSDLPEHLAEVVIDSTGSPAGLDLAVRLAAREVHVKSTHGAPAAGLSHLTELVVDEIGLARLPATASEGGRALARAASGRDARIRVAWLARDKPSEWLCEQAEVRVFGEAREALACFEDDADPSRDSGGVLLPRADLAVVDDAVQVDAVLRPDPAHERSLVRPRGEIWIRPQAPPDGASSLLDAIAGRELRLSSSRCGNFRQALKLLAEDSDLTEMLAALVTHRFGAAELERAFEVARTPECIKAVVVQGEMDP